MKFFAPEPNAGSTVSLWMTSDHDQAGTTQSLFKALKGQAFNAEILGGNIALIRPENG